MTEKEKMLEFTLSKYFINDNTLRNNFMSVALMIIEDYGEEIPSKGTDMATLWEQYAEVNEEAYKSVYNVIDYFMNDGFSRASMGYAIWSLIRGIIKINRSE